jgi:hypothetical protein
MHLARLQLAQAASAVLFGWRADVFQQGVRQEPLTDTVNPTSNSPLDEEARHV